MKLGTAYACAWISAAIAVVAGLYFTRNANCLWALFISAFISISGNEKNLTN
jgi:hypothetical protein